MVLEVVSSSLTIYPFMWYITKIPKISTNTLYQIHFYYLFLQRFWSKHMYKSSWEVINSNLLKKLNFTKFDNKVNYTTLYRYNTFKTTLPLSTILIEDPKASKLFKMYSTLLTQTTVVTAQTHPSHRFNFILNKELNISTFNLTKLKHKWLDSYHLFHNLFFYKLPILSFSTPVFRNELLSLNWQINDKLQTYWKYISPSFYLARNKVIK